MATTLSFTQQGRVWIAEATVNADYNLHIERESSGCFSMKQKGVEQGEYVECIGVPDFSFKKNIDHDFQHGVYPKYIRIESGSEVTSATLTEAEQ